MNFLFFDIDFSNKYLSPDVNHWTTSDVLTWWMATLPQCQQASWLITECKINGRDLFQMDQELLRQLGFENDSVILVLNAINSLKNEGNLRTLKPYPVKKDPSQVLESRLEDWTNEDVIKWWKTTLPQRCQKFIKAVRECNFEGKDLCVLDEDVLCTMEMKKLVQLKVLKALKVLRAS